MATVTVTNLTSSPLLIQDIYATIEANASVSFDRAVTDVPRMAALQAAVAAGSAAVSVTLSSDELNSGLTTVDSTVAAADLAPVAATAAAAPLITIRKSFSALGPGLADDVVIFAAGAVPYKMRILDAYALISAASAGGGQVLEVQPETGGAGLILAKVSTAATGRAGMDNTITTSALVNTTDALVIRRKNRDVTGELVLTVRRES